MINVVSTGLRGDNGPFHAYVHKELLCAYSAHYSEVYKSILTEPTEDVVTMDLPGAQVHSLVTWLYTGTMSSSDPLELLELYAFADQKNMLALRRFLMSKLMTEYYLEAEDSMPSLGRVSHNSGLFRYLVDLWASDWNQNALEDHTCQIAALDERKKIPRTFFYQLLRKFATMGDDKESVLAALKVPCNYHEHLNASEWQESMLPSYPDPSISAPY